MTYLAQQASRLGEFAPDSMTNESFGNEELCIKMIDKVVQNSFSESQLKKEPIEGQLSAKALFDETVKNKGEQNRVKTRFVNDSTMEVEGLSKMALHSYLLEAEKLGKKIEFVKTTTIKICN
ncbi:hypothetical protein KFE94_09890 [bacterium SCSIO 12643]|nr:hypothetical protein KFE94_09890 [bacterium SCSIO 12643]